jgi:ribonuclease-3
MSKKSLADLEKRLGYKFKDRHWLERALTHSSTNDDYNYQRLEFLGDRVLGLVMANALFEEFRKENEGGLAKRHTALVQGRMCSVIGNDIALGEYVILSEAERSAGGHFNENIIADAMEALLGAIFVDGGFLEAQKVTLALWGNNIKTLDVAPQDPKTELQEWAQGRGLDLPLYEIVDRTGPDHAPVFKVQVRVDGFDKVEVQGASRRAAEKNAAEKLLKKLKSHDR